MREEQQDFHRFPRYLLVAAIIFSIGWTHGALRWSNIEDQGIDIVNHAIMIHEMSAADGPSEAILGDLAVYPHGSHRLASLLTPLFGGNDLQAMRCTALLTLFVMLLAQFTILRQFMPPSLALLVLVLWQGACALAQVANINHFMWHWQYNFSRAVGAAALWLALALLVAPLTRRPRYLNELLTASLAGFALYCHIAPGAIALGTLLLYYAVVWLASRRAAALIGLLGTGLIAAWMMFGTSVWRYMIRVAASDGWLPISYEPVLALWIPTWFIAVYCLWRLTARNAGDCPATLPLYCGLIVAGGLQGYLLFRQYALGTAAPYAVKSVLFTTFALASLLWLAWLSRWWTGNTWARCWSQKHARPLRWLVSALALASGLAGLGTMLSTDLQRQRFGPERDATWVIRELQQRRSELRGCFYLDPAQRFASLFINASGLSLARKDGAPYYRFLNGQITLQAALADERIQTLLLPGAVEPTEIFSSPVPAQRIGPFWHCDLSLGRKIANGQFDAVIADCTRALRRDPANAQLFVQRGLAHKAKGALDAACADYTDAIKLDPRLSPAYCSRGNIHHLRGEYQQAIVDLTAAIQHNPNYLPSLSNLAYLLATCPRSELRNGRQAVNYGTRACELSQWQNPFCLGALAAALAEAGAFEQAIELQKIALESPEYNQADGRSARVRLGLYQQGKPYREARK